MLDQEIHVGRFLRIANNVVTLTIYTFSTFIYHYKKNSYLILTVKYISTKPGPTITCIYV
jgi:hypothetical protein